MPKTEPLVSIIMPAYNASAFIHSSINSVLEQSYLNWELIVVDDGSIDDTSLLVEEIEDHRIRLIRKVNEGVAAARNTGLKIARGEYIGFLDSDDLWLPEKLSEQVAFMESNPEYVFTYTNYSSFIDSNEEIPNKQLEPFIIEDTKNRLLVFNFIATLTVIARSSSVRSVGGFDESLFGPEDWDLWLKLSAVGDFGFIDSSLGKYREHDLGISKNKYLQLSNEYRVIQRHAFGAGNSKIRRQAHWFHSLKVCNYYVKKRNFMKAIVAYLRLFILCPLHLKNFTYPLKKIFGS